MTGKVFRVIHKRTGERFALKCMDANKIDAELLEDLVNEIELLQTVRAQRTQALTGRVLPRFQPMAHGPGRLLLACCVRWLHVVAP